MNLSTQFKNHWQIDFADFNPGNCHLLLAVSGGVDSVVLVDLVAKAGFEFSIAHCNFQLRGADSERDELFVSSLQGATEIFIKKFDTASFAEDKKMAIQEAARKLRYDWFEDLLNNYRSKFDKKILLVTAHHADDNIETVLMNYFRGTGISGMRGILPFQKDQSLIRPLLAFRKSQLIDYAKDAQLDFVEDVSNSSDKYTRNFFRNQLIPQIQNIFPAAEENILENIVRMREVASIYQDAVATQIDQLTVQKDAEIHIPILKLQKQKVLHTILWEITKQYGFAATQVSEIIKLMHADNGAFIASDQFRVIKNRNWLIIAKKASEESLYHIIEQGTTHLLFENGSLAISYIHQSPDNLNTDQTAALLDLPKVQFPLLVRKPRTGDYFYPLGMQKKKKLSRFFIDQKLSKTQKEKCWVIESNKKIIWVIGYRIDDRFKLPKAADQILQIKFNAG